MYFKCVCVFALSSACTYRSQRLTVDVVLYWWSTLFFETASLTELSLARVTTQQALELPISVPRAGNTDTCSNLWLSWRCWRSNFKSSYFHNKHYIHLPSLPTPKLWSSGRIGSACNHWAISLYPVPTGNGKELLCILLCNVRAPEAIFICPWRVGGVPGIHHLVYLLVQVTLLLYNVGQRMTVPGGAGGEMRGGN